MLQMYVIGIKLHLNCQFPILTRCFLFVSESKSQSNVITNHVVSGHSSVTVSSSVLVNSVSPSVNSVSCNSLANPSPLPSEAPSLNNGLGKESPLLMMPSLSVAALVNSNNNSVISSLQSSLSSATSVVSPQAVNALNSLSSSKSDLMPTVMNGPLSAGGVLQDKVSCCNQQSHFVIKFCSEIVQGNCLQLLYFFIDMQRDLESLIVTGRLLKKE